MSVQSIEYKELGQGPTLVLLHGFGGNQKQWEAVALAMAKSYRVIVPNLSRLLVGTATGDKQAALNFSGQVKALDKFLRSIDDGSGFHLAASSYGGALAWAVAITTGQMVQSLTLLCPMPPFPQNHFRSRYLRRILRLARLPSLLWIYLKTPFGRTGLTRLSEIFQVPWLERKKINDLGSSPTFRQLRLLTHVIHRFSRLIAEEDWSFWESRLGFINQPVCLIWGEQDRLYELDEPTRLLRLFNNGQLFHIEDTGHFSMTENPLPVVYILDQFLTRFQNAA